MPDADWVLYRSMRGKPLPATATLLGTTYALEKTLKRDFYAVTGVYRRAAESCGSAPDQVLLKIYHTGPLGKLRLRWLGRWLCNREVKFLRAVDGIDGVPRFLGRFRSTGLVREFIPGCNLREYTKHQRPDERFFPRLRIILDHIHRRGIAHNDLSKPENVLVKLDGAPVLIDFQIAVKLGWADWPVVGWPARRVMRYMQSVDRYHLAKQHRRQRPQDFSAEAVRRSKRKGVLLILHGILLRRPYRAVRHFVLRRYLRNNNPTQA
jgi:serine/threonine protein kinase